ncbi:Peptidoglycan-associated lipoprotein [Thalassocella blandensis]|nr:Peptidoglycan-associated lipoprotein [Thalassocella blandensis]
MKTLSMTSAIILTAALSTSGAYAKDKDMKTTLKGIGSFTGGALVGAMVGGPVGAVFGAAGGALFDEQHNKTLDIKNELEEAEMEISQLENEIEHQEITLISLENKIAKKLEFQVMFPTGVDTLTFEDIKRIESLSNYLKQNKQLRVRLDGHADPRGTDEYNNVLSSERAKSVAALLEDQGIAKERIDIFAFGSSKADPEKKDYDSFAFARRVNIEVFTQESLPQVTQTTIATH